MSAGDELDDDVVSAPDDWRVLMTMVLRLLEHWQLSDEVQARLLGLSPDELRSCSRECAGPDGCSSADLMQRFGHLLAIHRLLRNLFPQNRDLAYRWMTSPNAEFDGRTPVAVAAEKGVPGLHAIQAYLERAAKS